MQFTKTLSTAALALGLAVAGPLMAQDAAPAAPEAEASQYSVAELSAFVTAALAVNEVDQRYQVQVMETEDPAEQQQLIEAANGEMIAAVEQTPGITLEQYMEIGQAAEADPELNARLIAMVQDLQAQTTQVE